ncbi:MAG: MBL fold metallo-hydrolase [Gammaproteobacteria bacterium]
MATLSLRLDNSLSNYNYLIYCEDTRDCLVIDPLDVELILETAEKEKLTITQIVNTHEHRDHTGGNEDLQFATGAHILAHHLARQIIPGFDHGLHAGDMVKVGSHIALTVLETPGHTMHSICLHDKQSHAIYTGDTLFNCGCGNCHNGGDPEVMFNTFETQLQHLPDETRIYPGHDYIRHNLGFAKSFQPDLPAIALIEAALSDAELYISTLGEDKTVDPFFRLEDPELIQAIRGKTHLSEQPSRQEVFLALRQLRNKW